MSNRELPMPLAQRERSMPTTDRSVTASRRTAIIVGVLFIVGTVAGVLSVLVTNPILEDPEYLGNVAANGNQLVVGALLVLTMGLALAMVPVVLFPVARKHNEVLALGYVVFRGALETYANVHRGSGHYSQASTHLYEQAREIVLDYLGLDKDSYEVVFCSPKRAEALKAQLGPGLHHCLSSQELGLALGVRALAVESRALPRGAPDQAGGGTAPSNSTAPLATYEVLFTANTTEAINLVAESLARESERGIKPVVLNTYLEHNSNELPWRRIAGVSLIRFPVDAQGFVDLDELEGVLAPHNQEGRHGKKRIKLVTVSGASNVLGVFNDLAAISRIVHRYGARLLVDAAQLVAHRPVDMEAWGIDYLAFSAHKVYAPFGSGALVDRTGLLKFSPEELALIRSSGEENAGGIAALGKALALLQRTGLDVIQEEEQALTARALHGLAQIPGLRIYGIQDPDSPRFAHKGGVIVFGLEGAMAPQVARELAEQGGIGVRYGCHCAHLLIKRLVNIPPALELFQGVIVTLFPRVSLPGLTRVSLGIQNTAEEIDALVQVLVRIARQPRTEVDNSFDFAQDRPFASTETGAQKQMESFAMAAAQRIYAPGQYNESGMSGPAEGPGPNRGGSAGRSRS